MGQIKACIDQEEWVAVHSDVHEPPVNHVWVERAILLSSCPKRKKKNSAPASAEKGLESSEDVFIHQSLFCSSQGKKMTLRSSLTYTCWCLLYLVVWKICLKVSRNRESELQICLQCSLAVVHSQALSDRRKYNQPWIYLPTMAAVWI